MKILKNLLVLCAISSFTHCADVETGQHARSLYLEKAKELRKIHFKDLLLNNPSALDSPIPDQNYLLQAALSDDRVGVEVLLEMGANPDIIIAIPKKGFFPLIELVKMFQAHHKIDSQIIKILESHSRESEATDIND